MRPRPSNKPAAAKENVEALMRVEPLAIEVGLGLVGLVEGGQESALLRRISAIRKQLATELGYLFRRCASPTICNCAPAST